MCAHKSTVVFTALPPPNRILWNFFLEENHGENVKTLLGYCVAIKKRCVYIYIYRERERERERSEYMLV